MQDYNTIIGAIQMRLNGCPTRSVMERYKIESGILFLIMERYHAGGIPIEKLQMMPLKEVELLFYPVCPAKLDHTCRCKSGHGNC